MPIIRFVPRQKRMCHHGRTANSGQRDDRSPTYNLLTEVHRELTELRREVDEIRGQSGDKMVA